MNLKSYMRGLGIGIIVTAVLMGIGKNNTASELDNKVEDNKTVLADMQELSEGASSSSSSVKKEQEKENNKIDPVSDNEATEDGKLVAESKEDTDNKADAEDKESSKDKNASDTSKASEDNTTAAAEKTSEDSTTAAAEKTSGDSTPAANEKASGDNKSTATDNKDKKDADGNEQNVPTKLPVAGALSDDGQNKDKADSINNTGSTTGSTANAGKKAENGTVVDVVITSGESSLAIANKCENLGLVEEGGAFDKYLSTYGYDRKLTTGTHHIPMGATEAQIAQILTGKSTN